RCHGGGGAGGVRAGELVADRAQLPLLELADGEAAPPVGRADDRRVHQLQARPLAKGVRDDLRPPALFEEEPLEQVGRANHLAVLERKAQVRDAGLEVVPEARDHRGQLARVGLNEVVAQQQGQRPRRGLVTAARAGSELTPTSRRCARRTSPSCPSPVIPHAHSTASRGSPACSRSATPSTNRYATANSLRSRVAEAWSSCHRRSVTCLTADRLSVVAPVASRKAASMSRVLNPRANISTARRSSSAVRPASPARTRDTNGSGRSATPGTPHSLPPPPAGRRPRPTRLRGPR